MKEILLIILLFGLSLHLNAQNKNCTKKSERDKMILFQVGSSLGWSSPNEITGYDFKIGIPVVINRFYYNNSFGVDFENHITSNNYFKGQLLGYYLNLGLIEFNNYWIPINFTHKFSLKNELTNGVKKYNEVVFGTGIGYVINCNFSIQLTADIRRVKTFSERNTYITPSANLIYTIF